MICDICRKRTAVIFLTRESTNREKKVINICEKCYAEAGFSADGNGKTSADEKVFESLLQKIEASDPDFSRLCPGCGISLGEIKKTGRAGCPECYSVFEKEVAAILKKQELYGAYTGSLPKRIKDFRNALTDRADLQARLEKAVREEKFEKAAVYRDFLRALEKSSVSSSSDFEDEK